MIDKDIFTLTNQNKNVPEWILSNDPLKLQKALDIDYETLSKYTKNGGLAELQASIKKNLFFNAKNLKYMKKLQDDA